MIIEKKICHSLKFFRNILVCGILLASQSCACTSPDFAWGTTVNGMRLGLRTDNTCGNILLRLRLQNQTASSLDLLMGGRTGHGVDYQNLRFIARKAGQHYEVESFRMGQQVGGVVLPFFITLAPGAQYDFNEPREEFHCFINQKEVSLDQLLAEGFTIQAMLDVPPIARQARSSAWLGTVSSGVAKAN